MAPRGPVKIASAVKPQDHLKCSRSRSTRTAYARNKKPCIAPAIETPVSLLEILMASSTMKETVSRMDIARSR